MDAVLSGQFLISGRTRTDYFVEISKLLTNERALELVSDIILDQFRDNDIDTIVSDYSLGSSILGNNIAEKVGARFIAIKDLKRQHAFLNNEKVLVLVDALLTGRFAFTILQELRASNAMCVGISVFFLRNQEVRNKIANKGINVKCVLNFSNLFPDVPPKKKSQTEFVPIEPFIISPLTGSIERKKEKKLTTNNIIEQPDHLYTEINEGVVLKNELKRIDSGHKYFREYEDLVFRIFQYLLVPPLKPPLPQRMTSDCLERRDILIPNTGQALFYDNLRNRYHSEFIVIECKNFSGKIGKKEVGQLRLYARKKSVGRFGILVSRKSPSKSALKERANAYRDDDALILLIDDSVLFELIDHKIEGKDPAEYLDQMRLDFLCSV